MIQHKVSICCLSALSMLLFLHVTINKYRNLSYNFDLFALKLVALVQQLSGRAAGASLRNVSLHVALWDFMAKAVKATLMCPRPHANKRTDTSLWWS